MFETSRIELSLSALKKNVRFLKRRLSKNVRFSSVIKGNAYGHGIPLFVPMAESCGLRHFSVFSADEALAARESSEKSSQILIMGDVVNDALFWAVENDISFYVFDWDRLKAARGAAKRLGKKAKIHLEIETGLNRTGLTGTALKRAVKYIVDNAEHLLMEGVCTHFAGAESLSNYLRIKQQIQSFNTQSNWLSGVIQRSAVQPFLRHSACSAAVLTYPETVMDMARFGIAQYGFWPSKETEIQYYASKTKRMKPLDPLVRVLKWISRIMNIKTVKRGDYVGYGVSSLVTRDLKLAGVPVGYFHGFDRSLSNKGHVLVRGKRAPVVGMVNMNMMMIDITEIPGVRNGDEVVIIGKQGDNTISVGAFGELSRFINYEFLVRLPSEIPRIIVE